MIRKKLGIFRLAGPRWRCVVVTTVLLVVSNAMAEQFEDVPSNHWAAPSISIVTDSGVMKGCGGAFFCLNGVVTREDMAVWLERGLRGADYTPPPASGIFTDVDVSYCFAPWVEQLYSDGVTGGCSATQLKYCPYRPLSRAELAVFLIRVGYGVGYRPPPCTGIFADVPCPDHWAADWIEQLYRDGITSGCSASPLRFCPFSQVTRAQMAVFLVATLGFS